MRSPCISRCIPCVRLHVFHVFQVISLNCDPISFRHMVSLQEYRVCSLVHCSSASLMRIRCFPLRFSIPSLQHSHCVLAFPVCSSLRSPICSPMWVSGGFPITFPLYSVWISMFSAIRIPIAFHFVLFFLF